MARRVAVYEFIASGGWTATYGAPPPRSLATEGGAMLASIAADFAQAGVETLVLCDAEQEEPGDERRQLQSAAARCDWTVVIAPEFDQLLATRTAWVRQAGRLLGPSAAAIDLAADKSALCDRWHAAGVPTPFGRSIALGERFPTPSAFPYPAVCKLRYGAGSQEMRLLTGCEPADDLIGQPSTRDWRLERHCPGLAVSVAFLCGPQGAVPLPACRQVLAQDGTFAYYGGECPLPPALADRATQLAQRALAAAGEEWLGYVGVDLVLGPNPSGRDDVAIEINPRLTTSYVGLRAAVEVNLAELLLAAAEGRPVESPAAQRAVCFTSDGAITYPQISG